MKKITIIGDSNACGEWFSESKDIDGNIIRKETFRNLIYRYDSTIVETELGLDTYLDEMGYSCFNVALGGNSNISTLIDLEYSLLLRLPRIKPRFLYPNYIIWMITEPLREFRYLETGYGDRDSTYHNEIVKIFKTSKSMTDLNEKWLDLSFKIAENIYQKTKIPFILVEGLSGTYDLEKKYNFSIKVFKNWLSNIAGVNAPITSTNQVFEMISTFLLKNERLNELEDIINRYDSWSSLMMHHNDFPDNCHPSHEFHKELSQKIDNFIKENEK